MSLLFGTREETAAAAERDLGDTVNQLVPLRPLGVGGVPVTIDSAMRHSAVWACLRLRSSLISTMPVDTFRYVNGVAVEVPDSPFIANPGGPGTLRHEWIQASQVDIDRCGNAFGVIRAKDAAGKPAQVDLVPYTEVNLKIKSGRIVEAKVGGDNLPLDMLWHERGFVLPGVPVGLSTIAYSAMSVGGYLSAQQFALDWFASGAHPAGHLQNTEQDSLSNDVIQVVKERFKAASQNRDIFVSGSEWIYTPAAADAAQAAFLDEMRYGIADICRFFDVPGDMIGAETSSGSITYANITQRNLQLLIMHLGPALIRREQVLSAQTPAPRFVKFNTDALLRMDPASVTANLAAQIDARLRTPSEGRALLNLSPLTDAEFDEFDRLFPPKAGSGMAPAGAFMLPFLNLPAPAPEPTPGTPPEKAKLTEDDGNRELRHALLALASRPNVVNVATPEVRNEFTLPETTVNVAAPEVRNEITTPTPNVTIRNDVAAPSVTVHNDVPTPEVRVAGATVNVTPTVIAEMPARQTTTEVERDRNGLIRKTTSTETDA